MTIITFQFLLFVFLVSVINQIIVPSRRPLFLTICSFAFAGMISLETMTVLILVTVITYFTGIWMDKCVKQSSKKALLIIHVLVVLILLLGIRWEDSKIISSTNTRVIVIVGLSFYALESISYVIDVYCNRIQATRNYINIALFLSFSPTFMSGQIKKAQDFFSETSAIRSRTRRELLDYDELRRGLILIIWGYFLKLMIAERLSLFVNNVYAAWFQRGTVILVLSSIAYSLQLYVLFFNRSLCIRYWNALQKRPFY